MMTRANFDRRREREPRRGPGGRRREFADRRGATRSLIQLDAFVSEFGQQRTTCAAGAKVFQ